MSGYLVFEGYLFLQGVGFVWLAMGISLSFLIIIDKNILQLHLIGLGWGDDLSHVFC